MEPAVTLDLSLKPFEQIALEFHNAATAQTSHMDVVTLRTALVIMLFSLQVHKIKFIDEAMSFEQSQGAVDGYAVNARIKAARMPQDLAGIEMLFSGLDYAENGATLAGHAQAARHQFCLQSSRGFGLRQGHDRLLLIPSCNYTVAEYSGQSCLIV